LQASVNVVSSTAGYLRDDDSVKRPENEIKLWEPEVAPGV
jgi:hypothetical protein